MVYADFVDFKSRLPSVSHSLIWSKLSTKEVSTKFINILRSFYKNASAAIEAREGLTDLVMVSLGVLQGEVLSPQLFSNFY